jgi:adrenodoxin-NADP+ reductase
MGARTFVNWYNGHPDFAADAELTSLLSERLSARAEGAQVVVLGQGNVALDCARVLAKDPSDLASTDICEHALGVLRAAPRVAQVSVVGRRGHVQAAFTIKELRELTRIAGAATVADPAELQMAMTPASAEELEQARPRKRLTELIQSLPSTAGPDAKTSVALRFLLLPKAILPDPRAPGKVGAIVLERARLEGPPGKQVAVDTGEQLKVPCQLVLRSIGYRSLPIPGLPFDKRRSVVRNEKGRVLTDDNTQVGVRTRRVYPVSEDMQLIEFPSVNRICSYLVFTVRDG